MPEEEKDKVPQQEEKTIDISAWFEYHWKTWIMLLLLVSLGIVMLKSYYANKNLIEMYNTCANAYNVLAAACQNCTYIP